MKLNKYDPYVKLILCLFMVMALKTIILMYSISQVKYDSRPAVLVVVQEKQQLKNYTLAQKTLECYCQIYGYHFIQVVMESSPILQEKCPQKDIMFQRHCVTVEVLKANPHIQHLLFLDADFGVVNPRHLIENYIDPNYDLVFYERIFSPEIAAGSYIIKNTPYAIGFLEDWVAYADKMPDSFNGRDNAALHQVFVDRFQPYDNRSDICLSIWRNSSGWEDVKLFVSCARSILNYSLTFDRIKVHSKISRSSWARDAWLTNSQWAPKDFILHAWKENMNNRGGFGKWHSPFLPQATFPLSKCSPHLRNPFQNWIYNPNFTKNETTISRKLLSLSLGVQKKYAFKFFEN